MINDDENDLYNKSDEDLRNEAYKILEEDVFSEAENVSKKQYNSYKSTEYNYNYNSYENNYNKSNSSKNKNTPLIAALAICVMVCLGMIMISLNSRVEDIYYEEIYDIEYDTNNDGYLDYNEKDVYISDKSSDYEKYYEVNEIFNDIENKILYFEVENKNSYLIDWVTLKLAFYDENNNLVDIGECSIDNTTIDKKVIVSYAYGKEFDHYDKVIHIDMYYNNAKEVNADIKVIETSLDIRNNEITYSLINNSLEDASGEIFFIFRDGNGNIIGIQNTYVFDLKPGKKYEDILYVYSNLLKRTPDVEINVSNIILNVY